ncbi:cupin domain-containing protein [Reinekea sp.]|jgi:anti-sigma factor ChrR (cupin superfamily)|uniref:cupin domain-containing protein n=1 Tax=Reinekea sp. TaxID=1970455 RepID=UPI00258003B7|nr:cupin domain-containing protein [Reinekea sp.]|tara:strand:- start:495 stop:851 length:357 start_codon:yes stop_codon:yes gene_type:complete
MDEMFKRIAVHDLLDLEKTLKQRKWQELRPRVHVSYFYRENDDGMSAALLHYEADARVAAHEHIGYEHIFILHGSQQDANGIYKKGSLLIHSKDTIHDVYSKDGCLALAIWQNPVQFI